MVCQLLGNCWGTVGRQNLQCGRTLSSYICFTFGPSIYENIPKKYASGEGYASCKTFQRYVLLAVWRSPTNLGDPITPRAAQCLYDQHNKHKPEMKWRVSWCVAVTRKRIRNEAKKRKESEWEMIQAVNENTKRKK